MTSWRRKNARRFAPSLGVIIGAGPLAAAFAALAAGTGAGAIAGGASGVFRDSGLPGDIADRYASHYQGGDAILAVTLRRPEIREMVEGVLRSHGANALEAHQAYLS